MKQKILINIILLYLLVLLNSCGALMNKYRNTVKINSNPQGAEIIYKDSVIGITPSEIYLYEKYNIVNIELRKNGFITDKFYLERENYKTQMYLDIIPLFVPALLTALANENYMGFNLRNYKFNLRNIDSLNNINADTIQKHINVYEELINSKTDFTNLNGTYKANSEFYIEILPIIFLNAGNVSLNINHYIDIYNLQKSKDDRLDLGLRIGWGFNHLNSFYDNHISRGYYILPSISYEIVTSFGMSNKYVVSIGPSYINNFSEVASFPCCPTDLIFEYTQNKGLALSFNAQYIRKDYVDNFIYGFSAGYLNKSQYFQFLFGFFVF